MSLSYRISCAQKAPSANSLTLPLRGGVCCADYAYTPARPGGESVGEHVEDALNVDVEGPLTGGPWPEYGRGRCSALAATPRVGQVGASPLRCALAGPEHMQVLAAAGAL